MSTADVLNYVQELEGTGLTREQAVAIARGSAAMLEQRIESLATQQSVDALAARLDDRVDGLEARMETLATKTELRALADTMNLRFAEVDRRLIKLEDLPAQMKVNTWVLAVLTIAVVVPKIQAWFSL